MMPRMTTQAERDRDLEELREEAERLVALLKHPQPGLSTWGHLVSLRMNGVKQLIRQITGDD